MATISDIEVKRELRPCLIVNGDTEKKALFHMWEQNSQIITPSPMVGGHGGGVISAVMGIVELEDGSVIRVAPCQVQFIDGKIQEYVFKKQSTAPSRNTEDILYHYICKGCSECCNCYETGKQHECEWYEENYEWMIKGSSPVATKELFGHIDGQPIYVFRDEYGRIAITDELLRELIERATGSSPEEVKAHDNIN